MAMESKGFSSLFGHVAFGAGEIQGDIQDAENGLIRRVSVTVGFGAAGLVVDGLDDAELGVAFRVVEEPCPGCPVGSLEGGVRGVTDVAGLGVLIDHGADGALVGGVDDTAVFVEDTDAEDVLLAADRIDDLVHFLRLILEHGEAGASLDGLGAVVRVALHDGDHGTAVGDDEEIGEKAEDDRRRQGDRHDEPVTDPCPHPPPSLGATLFSATKGDSA